MVLYTTHRTDTRSPPRRHIDTHITHRHADTHTLFFFFAKCVPGAIAFTARNFAISTVLVPVYALPTAVPLFAYAHHKQMVQHKDLYRRRLLTIANS